MNAISVPAGRFVPARYFPEENESAQLEQRRRAPVSVAYDLFGTGKTALKASWSKYFAHRSHALCLHATRRRAWSTKAATGSTRI